MPSVEANAQANGGARFEGGFAQLDLRESIWLVAPVGRVLTDVEVEESRMRRRARPRPRCADARTPARSVPRERDRIRRGGMPREEVPSRPARVPATPCLRPSPRVRRGRRARWGPWLVGPDRPPLEAGCGAASGRAPHPGRWPWWPVAGSRPRRKTHRRVGRTRLSARRRRAGSCGACSIRRTARFEQLKKLRSCEQDRTVPFGVDVGA